MSCQYSINIAPYQNGINSTLLPAIGNTNIIPPGGTTTGTYNDMNFNDGEASFSGSVGNTTTDGYYVTYNGNILNLQNIMNFTIEFPSSTYCLEGRNQQVPFTTTKLFNYSFFSGISSKISVSSEQCLYVPQISGKVCQQCCKGADNFFNSCYWDYKCDCKEEVITPSSYYCFGDPNDGICAICAAISYTGTITTTPQPDTISLSYITGNTLPSGYTVAASYTVNLPAGFISPLNTIYFYNFEIIQLFVNITNVEVSDILEPPGGWDVSEFNSEFNSLVTQYVVPLLNNLINNQAFEFQLVYTPPI